MEVFRKKKKLPQSIQHNLFIEKVSFKAQHPLSKLSIDRDRVLDSVVEAMARKADLRDSKWVEQQVNDSIFWERRRLESRTDPIRDALDEAFWKDTSSALLEAGVDRSDASRLWYKKIARYHAEEISGNFNPNVYRLATAVVPRGLGWLLQALSWKSLRKQLFAEKLDLRRKVHLQGRIDALRNLAQKGTVVLVPTHFSNLDSMLIGWALYELGLPPFCYGAGLNLFSNPVFGYFMNNLGAYKVDRRKKHELYKETLKAYSTHVLERGCHTLFFPGGGRSRSGSLEKQLKLGLLGTALDAYTANLLSAKPLPNIYIVPCVISYHFVLEADSLIADFLTEQGKSRFMIEDDESSKPKVMAQFLINFFKASSTIYLNFGQALDPFGNLVDDEGHSLGANGRKLDLPSYVTSGGKITTHTQRDNEYTRILGERIVQRFHRENIALTSHFVAYTYFELLRQKHNASDIFRLFRLSESETQITVDEFVNFATPALEKLHELHDRAEIFLEPALRSKELRNILESAQRNMGVYHSLRPLKLSGSGISQILSCEDLKLLFYYHNRMEGYQLLPNAR